MQEKSLFEYAVIRVVPKVDREEFLNIGVIVYCAKFKFLKFTFSKEKVEKLNLLDQKIDVNEIFAHLTAIGEICTGGKQAGPIGQLDLASKFRWLTATRSTIIQPSKVHPGLCTDPEIKMQQLFENMVL